MRDFKVRNKNITQHICLLWLVLLVVAICGLCSCGGEETSEDVSEDAPEVTSNDEGIFATDSHYGDKDAKDAKANELRDQLSITEDYRSSFEHGDKSADYQKYIVLHDTEDDSSAEDIVNYWDSSGAGIAAHFIINKDGTIVQCVDMDTIAHHAGFGDAGHNELYGVEDESRDDKVGTTPIGSSFPDYGMNSYSIGIELVHVGGQGDYPEAQLEALDTLIAYIDAYYGTESTIIDHKAWRTGNSDTSAEFSDYLASYQKARKHAE